APLYALNFAAGETGWWVLGSSVEQARPCREQIPFGSGRPALPHHQLHTAAVAIVVQRQLVDQVHTAGRRRALPAAKMDGRQDRAAGRVAQAKLEVALTDHAPLAHLELAVETRLGEA